MPEKEKLLPDQLNQKIGVLTRREIEARILAPIIEALGKRFGQEEVLKIVQTEIIKIAQKEGRALAETMKDNSSKAFRESLQFWTKDDALEIDTLEESDEKLHFNVTRCRYAELYRALGIPELGTIFSCNRDAALIEGFNKKASLNRTQTIMNGASHCNFRYTFPKAKKTK